MKKLLFTATFWLVANVLNAQDVLITNPSELRETPISISQALSLANSNNYPIIIDGRVSSLLEFQRLQADSIEHTSLVRNSSALYGNKAAGGVIVVNRASVSRSRSANGVVSIRTRRGSSQ